MYIFRESEVGNLSAKSCYFAVGRRVGGLSSSAPAFSVCVGLCGCVLRVPLVLKLSVTSCFRLVHVFFVMEAPRLGDGPHAFVLCMFLQEGEPLARRRWRGL